MKSVLCDCGATNEIGNRKFRRWKEGKAKIYCINCGQKIMPKS